MRPVPSPSFLVATVALVLAAGGTGYAAGKVTSAQIQDGAVQSRDVRNGSLTGEDVRSRSIPRGDLDRSCGEGKAALFGGCVRRASSGPSSHQGAIDDCNRRDGRLPTTLELGWIRSHGAEFGWADGNPSQYEFTADYTAGNPFTPIAFDRAGNAIDNASAQLFWHHCVTS